MLARNLRIALIESEITWADKQANLERLEQNLKNIPEGTDVVVLPEMFTTGVITQDREQAAQLAERFTGDTIRTLQRLANEYQIAIVGSFLSCTASLLYNRAFFIEPGESETFYDKCHLFSFAGEDKVYNRGKTEAPIIRFRGFNFKLVICYDLRFPVFCRNRRNEYDALIVVANWPMARQNAWRQLLIARAIENGCYVCGGNCAGQSPDGTDFGSASSLIINYKGKIVAQRATSPIIAADLSPALLQQFRDKFPAWQDADQFSIMLR